MPNDDSLTGGTPTIAIVIGCVIGAFFLFVLTMIVLTAVRNRRVLKDAGLDPLAAQAQLAVRFAQGQAMAPQKTLEQRLAELADLHSRGIISDAEHTTARASALAER